MHTTTSTRTTIALLAATITLALTATFGTSTGLGDQANAETYEQVVAGRRSP